MSSVPAVPSGMTFTQQSVLKLCQSLKRKDSHVEEDQLPLLVRAIPELFAESV